MKTLCCTFVVFIVGLTIATASSDTFSNDRSFTDTLHQYQEQSQYCIKLFRSLLAQKSTEASNIEDAILYGVKKAYDTFGIDTAKRMLNTHQCKDPSADIWPTADAYLNLIKQQCAYAPSSYQRKNVCSNDSFQQHIYCDQLNSFIDEFGSCVVFSILL